MFFHKRLEFGSNELWFFVKISPSLKHPKNATQQAHQAAFAFSLESNTVFILLFMFFRIWKVTALRVWELLSPGLPAFLNLDSRAFDWFLLFLNFLKPKKLWILLTHFLAKTFMVSDFPEN